MTMRTIGERSSAMPPRRTGGMIRRIWRNTGSVTDPRTCSILAAGVPELIGNQVNMIRTKITIT